jgi:adenosylcobinamide hydrolase
MVGVLPDLLTRVENGLEMPFLLWRFATPLLAIASGPLGGGIGPRSWIINATVPMSYDRDDPDIHLGSLAAGLGLTGAGLGFLTGVDVGRRVVRRDDGALVVATVGIGEASWAAAAASAAPGVGTVNVFAFLPVRLSDAALVNAVATVAEAKAQAFVELGYAGTGTATDATCVLCPLDGLSERYGGPRSTWGARLARAVHQAVLVGDRPGLP